MEKHSKGGKARATLLTPSKRSQIAKKAAAARWAKYDPVQKQYEEGHPVEKPVRYTQKGWDYIRAYGKLLGMTEAQMVTHLLIRAVTELVSRDALNSAASSARMINKIKKRRGLSNG